MEICNCCGWEGDELADDTELIDIFNGVDIELVCPECGSVDVGGNRWIE